MIASVVVEWAIRKSLDYQVGSELQEQITPGMLVEVPVRNKFCRGIVTALKKESSFDHLQPIRRLLSKEPILDPPLLQLACWMAEYYGTPLHRVLRLMVPGGVKKQVELKQQLWVKRAKSKQELLALCQELREKEPAQSAVLDGLLKFPQGRFLSELLQEAKVSKSPVDTLVKKGVITLGSVDTDFDGLEEVEYFYTPAKKLTQEQQAALQSVTNSLDQFAVHLLHGITGSGKTEVYLHAIDAVLKKGKSVLLLLPEIALTMQMIERFKSRIQVPIGVIHSLLSDGQRAKVWKEVAQKKLSIVVGARSALFVPLKDLGLIIVDEEHEPSFKQTQEMPCYHARDVAIMRGVFHQVPVLLGSATPSLESFYNAQVGKYQLSTLSVRPTEANLAAVKVVDMKREFERANGFTLFSQPLLDGIKSRLAKGEQTILFLNRRGYHTTTLCANCGYVWGCPHCDVKLTLHLKIQRLRCHLCPYELALPLGECPKCKTGEQWLYKGYGTEQVQRALHAIFPEIRTLRLDADTTRHRGSHEQLLRQFRTAKADLLIGTQMVTKGLNFPNVTLVGVLNCDSSLNIPDFRASETVFQLVTQVSGRAGRGVLPGEVILQSMIPETPLLQWAAAQNYHTFFENEMETRKAFFYPPFVHLLQLTASSLDEQQVKGWMEMLYQTLKVEVAPIAYIHPVMPASPAKVKDRYFFSILLRTKQVLKLQRQLHLLMEKRGIPRGIFFLVDVDPLSA